MRRRKRVIPGKRLDPGALLGRFGILATHIKTNATRLRLHWLLMTREHGRSRSTTNRLVAYTMYAGHIILCCYATVSHRYALAYSGKKRLCSSVYRGRSGVCFVHSRQTWTV